MRFIVPGQPYGKARPRKSRFGVYNPKGNKDYEKRVQEAYRAARGFQDLPESMPIWINLELVYAIPKSTPKKKREMMLAGKIRPMVKPDVDNCLKSVMDALNGHAYIDDKQVILTRCIKRYGDSAMTIIDIGRYYT